MAKRLVVDVKPKTALAKAVPQSLYARLKYTREVPSENLDDAAPKTVNTPGSRREELDTGGRATLSVDDYADETTIILQIEFAQGSVLWETDDLKPSRATLAKLTIAVPDEVYAAATRRVVPAGDGAVFVRDGRFVKLDDAILDMSGYRLYVAPIRPNQLADGSTNPQMEVVRTVLGLTGTGEVTTFEAVQLDLAKLAARSINALGLQSAIVHSDGAFDISVDIVGDEIAWLWLLLGPSNYAGYQLDPVATQPRTNVVIVLPLAESSASGTGEPTSTSDGDTAEASDGGQGGRPPLDFDERQLIDHPDQFSDDPGGFCTPFEKPQRILGEQPFFTVLRIDQPEIGGQGSLKVSRPISLDVAPPIRLTAVSATLSPSDSTGFSSRSPVLSGASAMRASLAATVGRRLELRAALDRDIFKPSLDFWRKWVRERSKDREPVSGDNPIEWEGDPSIYQAASVTGGHVLEWRVRHSSAGYGLGDVVRTLTLAPRQTKRISKISWRRREAAARREVTEVSDALTQVTTRARDYTDAVKSSLSEWSRGQSKSRTTGVAGGIGFAMGPVIIGGGAAHGRASSSSSQSGGRRVAASEHQQLRDAIRQYGEATRRLESTVVTEVTQEEEVEGVAETLRNINYCHSLTVVYYEILRHLRVDTEFAGLRECLFVPFSITPFDVDKALKWREQLQQGMLDRRLLWALDYLDEVDSAWVNSSIPAGPRMDQETNYLTGSIYVQLSIERPRDIAPEEELETYYTIWTPLAPILGIPVRHIVAQMTRSEDDKDRFYQREVAPTMAARWADRLELEVGGSTLPGVDFTLATRYRFGRTVRIDFTAPVTGLTRRQLVDLTLRSTQPLAVGSVANVKSLTLHYHTDHYDRRVQSVPTTLDLIDPANGQPDSGADLHVPLTAWEEQDQRRYIEDAVERLITHLNANLVYYHKVIWWLMDRDELYMLLDGFTAPYGRRFENGAWVEDTGRSIASVVERDPMAILGNTLVMRVAAGAFLGIDGHESPEAARRYYYDSQVRTEPLRVSLPTEGLYAQALMDKCEACEEHHGSLDWVLTNAEPELEALADQLGTRRQAPTDLTPTQMPESIISLQNAPAAPDPTGLAGVLQAATTSGAFRDMAGLQGTQQLAGQGLQAAAGLATSFGQNALAVRLAEMEADKAAGQKLSSVTAAAQRAVEKGQMTNADAQSFVSGFAQRLAGSAGGSGAKQEAEGSIGTQAQNLARELGPRGSGTLVRATPGGTSVASFDGSGLLAQTGERDPIFNPLDPVNQPFVERALKQQAVEWAAERTNQGNNWRASILAAANDEYLGWASNPANPDQNRLRDQQAIRGSGHPSQANLHARLRSYIANTQPTWTNARHDQFADDFADDSRPWSAAFVSHLMSQAGIGRADGFRLSHGHSQYTIEALVNRLNRDYARPFWLYRPSEKPVAIGDVVVKARAGDQINFDRVFSTLSATRPRIVFENRTWRWGGGEFVSHADVVVEIVEDPATGDRFAFTMGGNTEHLTGRVDTVGKKKYRLDAAGHVVEEVFDALHNQVTGGAAAANSTHNNNSVWAIVKILGQDEFEEWRRLFQGYVSAADTSSFSVDSFLEVFGQQNAAGDLELPAALMTHLQAGGRGAAIFPESSVADFSDVDRAVLFKPIFQAIPANVA